MSAKQPEIGDIEKESIGDQLQKLAKECEDFDEFKDLAFNGIVPKALQPSFDAHMLEFYCEFKYGL